MAVMNKMRDMTSIILYTLILAFIGTIIFSWGMNYSGPTANTTVIGEVDGVEIDAKQYDLALSRQMEQYRQQSGGDIADGQITFIRNQVWEAMIRDVLIRKELEKKEIRATDAEIVYRLFNAPPEILKSNPSFQDEQQKFDMAQYQKAINNPDLAPQWAPIEGYLRDNLPYEKFQQRLLATVRITEEELRREYLKENQSAKVKYIFVDPKSFSREEFDITDEMIEDYYQTHKDEYKQEEQRAFDYVLLSKQPTNQDSVEIRTEANRIAQLARTGDDFAELAETYSEDTGSRDKGGSLGYFGRGAMVQAFEDAAFAANIGDIVGPVESQFGLHVIKIEDKRLAERDGKGKRKEEVKASHVLLKFVASRNTINRIKDDADYLATQAEEGSLANLAAQSDYAIKKSGLFVKGSGFIPGIGVNTRVSNFAFRSNVGDVGPVVDTNRGLLVFKITESKPARTKPLDDVSTIIRNKLISEEQMKKAGELAQKIHTAIQGGTDFEKSAKEDSVEVLDTESFKRSGFVTGVGRDASFIGTAFSLENVGDVSSPIQGTRGYYILKLLEKGEFNEQDYLAKKATIAAAAKQRKENQVFANWYAHEKEKSDIKDYRNRFYN